MRDPRGISPAAALAAQLSTGTGRGAVDIDAVARELGVRVVARRMSPVVWGLTASDREITVNAALSDPQRRFALAHELAHVLVRRGHASPDDEEHFADTFAQEFLVPAAVVRELPLLAVDEVAGALGVERAIVLAQLAAIGRVPAVIELEDGTVVCAKCGWRPHVPGCACSRARYRAKRALRAPAA